jgi:HD-like signal output (HDOD) protein
MIVATSSVLAEKLKAVAASLNIPAGYASSADAILALKPVAVIAEAGNPIELNMLYKIRETNPAIPRIIAFSALALPMNVMISMRIAHRFIDLKQEPAELASIIGEAIRLSELFMSQQLQKYIRTLAFLPRLPALYVQVEEAVHMPGSSLSKAAEIIERDQTVTSHILKLVNAAAFAGNKPVTKVADAVTRIGINNLKAMILAVSIFSGKITHGIKLDFHSLHAHAFAVARCSRLMAQHEGLPSWSQDMLFLAGLLHDIGSLVLITSDAMRYEQTLLKAQAGPTDMLALEQKNFGVDHAMLGGYIARLWGFPDILSELIMHHHDREKEDVSFKILHAADTIAQKLLYHGRGEGIVFDGEINDAWQRICKPVVQEILAENAAAHTKK